MGADLVAILLVPVAGDPDGLLAPGRCCAAPPVVIDSERDPKGWVAPTCVDRFSGLLDADDRHLFGTQALPLHWDGALVYEGWDRLIRRLDADESDRISDYPGPTQILQVAEWAVREGLAERVVCLVREDGRLVEVDP